MESGGSVLTSFAGMSFVYLVLAVAFAAVRGGDRDHLTAWGWGFAVLCLKEFLSALRHAGVLEAQGAELALYVLAALLVSTGARELVRGRAPRILWVFAAGAVLWLVVLSAITGLTSVVSGPVYAVGAVAIVDALWHVGRTPRAPWRTVTWLGLGLALVNSSAYPFLEHLEWGWRLSKNADMVQTVAIGFGLLLLHLDRAFEDARSRAEELRRAYLGASEGLFRAGPRGDLRTANPRLREILGVDRGDPLPSLACPELYRTPADAERVAVLLADGKPITGRDVVWVGADGVERPVRLHALPVLDERRQLLGHQGAVRDMSAETILRGQLQQRRRLEELGRLAGGVAHDFNNLLTSILAGSDALLETLDEDRAEHKELRQVREAARQAATRTRQLLEFSRRQAVTLRGVDLVVAVDDTVGVLRSLIGDTVEVRWERPTVGLVVMAGAGQLEQLVVNLALRARDVAATELVVAVHGGEGRGWLSVRDNGPAVSQVDVLHMFEPFYVGGPGRGDGLAMAAVYGIVTQLGGSIRVTRGVHGGLTFTVELPRREGPVAVTAPPVERRRGSATVLVVEDEDRVRRVVSRVLRRAGHTVLEAASGEAALAHLEERVEVLVTDVSMPGMGGVSLVREVRRRRPLPVLFLSGSSTFEVPSDLQEGTSFLAKPFSGSELVDALARAGEAT